MGIIKRHRIPRKQKKKAKNELALIFHVKPKRLNRYLKVNICMPIEISCRDKNYIDDINHAKNQICSIFGLPSQTFNICINSK